MKAKCSMEFDFPDKRSADAAEKAISHEKEVGSRSTIRIHKKDRQMTIDIEASDVVALRAAANSCLRSIQVFEGIGKKVEPHPTGDDLEN